MTDLLEDAIRAGVARGMDEAPAVPDLAERVRALPSGSRPRWPLLAAAASVAGLVLAGGLLAAHHTTTSDVYWFPNAPSSSAAGSVQPPFTAVGTETSGRPLTGAVGTWVPVWFAGYDGLSPSGLSPQARLQIGLRQGGPGTAARMQLAPRTTSCQVIPVVLTSPSGHVVGAEPEKGRRCTGVSTAVERAFGVAMNNPNIVGLGKDGALTIYRGGVPLAQFVRQGRSLPPQQSNPSLADETLGSWSRLDVPRSSFIQPRPKVALGGLLTLSLDSAGKYNGSSRCATMTGSFDVHADGSASFSAPAVKEHSCPLGSDAVGAISDARRVARYGHFLDLLDDQGRILGSFEEAVPNEVEGNWVANAPYANVSFNDGVIQTEACGSGMWTYTIDASGSFKTQRHDVAEKCSGPRDPGGIVTALREATEVRLNGGGQLQLVSDQGSVLVTLTRVTAG